jgi:carbon monoxide dehydrogenase subunit G
MDIKGNVLLHNPPSLVWEALNDPKVLSRCTPGCKVFEAVGDSEYHVVLELGLAAVKGTYDGKIVITDQVPGSSYHMSVSGEGLTGFVRGDGDVSLAPEGDNTRLTYQVDAQVGGAVAGVGQRVMGGISKMMVGQFFSRLEKEIAATS